MKPSSSRVQTTQKPTRPVSPANNPFAQAIFAEPVNSNCRSWAFVALSQTNVQTSGRNRQVSSARSKTLLKCQKRDKNITQLSKPKTSLQT